MLTRNSLLYFQTGRPIRIHGNGIQTHLQQRLSILSAEINIDEVKCDIGPRNSAKRSQRVHRMKDLIQIV